MKKEIYDQAHKNRDSLQRIQICHDAFHRQIKEKDGKTKVVVNNKTCWLDNKDFNSIINTLDKIIKTKDKEFESIGEKDYPKVEGLSFNEVISKIKIGEEYIQIIKDTDFNYVKIYMNEEEGLRIGAYLKENNECIDLPFDYFRLDDIRFKQNKKEFPKKSYKDSKYIF